MSTVEHERMGAVCPAIAILFRPHLLSRFDCGLQTRPDPIAIVRMNAFSPDADSRLLFTAIAEERVVPVGPPQRVALDVPVVCTVVGCACEKMEPLLGLAQSLLRCVLTLRNVVLDVA